ncbi:unnamed protein product [Meloidogyne enterolobii]|uniref:Uncharacterized protein n=1 Tax=Meloidogyne enterolobii TaxID=390850 RepID=A0ACB0YGU9_MELEN
MPYVRLEVYGSEGVPYPRLAYGVKRLSKIHPHCCQTGVSSFRMRRNSPVQYCGMSTPPSVFHQCSLLVWQYVMSGKVVIYPSSHYPRYQFIHSV